MSEAKKESVPFLVVGAAVAFGLVLLFPGFVHDPPPFNDVVLHHAMVEGASGQAWAVDFWFPPISAGFPMFLYYPHLSHLTAATVTRVVPFVSDASRVYDLFGYLLLSFLPVSVFVSMRRLEISRWGAAFAAALYPIVATRPYFGIGWESYVYVGSGLMPQIWGTFLFFPAIAWGYRATRGGGAYGAGLLLGACALAHFIYGYMAALSLGLLLLLPDREHPFLSRLLALARVAGVTVLATAYFALPLVLHKDLLLRSRLEASWKWDSIGWQRVLEGLVMGEIFDARGIPVLTLLFASAIVIAILATIARGDTLRRWLLLCLAVWIFLFCGREAWGGLVDLLPLSSGLHMHRFVAGVQAFGLILSALALERIACWIMKRRYPWLRVVAIALVAAILLIPLWRRVELMLFNNVRVVAASGDVSRASDLHEISAFLETLPPGRVHAGMYNNWGKQSTVAEVPLYTHLQNAGFDMVGYLFHAMAPPGEWLVRADYRRFEMCDLFNARYLVAPATIRMPGFAREIGRHGSLAVYEVPTGGYFGVGRVEPSPPEAFSGDWEGTFRYGMRWMESAEPRAGIYRSWDEPVDPLPPGPVAGNVLEEAIEPGSYAARVELASPGDVVLKATYHPYWRASVDDEPVRITRVLPGLMAVRVPGGSHEVAFTYRPPVWKKVLFFVSVLAFVAGALAPAVRRLR